MVAVVLGSVVSVGIALFAMLVILHEFRMRWPQIAAALAFDDAAFAAPLGAVRRPAAPRQMWPMPVRVQPARRAA